MRARTGRRGFLRLSAAAAASVTVSCSRASQTASSTTEASARTGSARAGTEGLRGVHALEEAASVADELDGELALHRIDVKEGVVLHVLHGVELRGRE